MKTALVVNADGTTSLLDVATEFLSKMQNAVDGLIQPIDLSDKLTMWVNEEFLLRNSFEPNLLGTAMYQSVGGQSVIMGSVVFTGGSDEDGDTLALDDTHLVRLMEYANKARGWVETGVMN